ncbi:lysophospholipase [Chitiniphilus purpureus]|uniref:Lysophospholipase n=1 Tax=Chitiniphilus purpureus TaxID=2981137 RepID=A0ABY6DRZ7_9NEIS|nr:lysophospholipase [Chitiniphilus sp. CD1]UXY16241.1 lysophospholipase [Chitiniphilus sp. CD1]
MRTSEVRFDDDGVPLAGSCDLPDAGVGRDILLLQHGFTGHRIELAYYFVDLARRLTAAGITVYRFDFRGCGESGGRFEDITVADQARQVGALLAWLRTRHPDARLHLAGFSMGGLAAARAAQGAALSSLTLIAPAGNLGELVERACAAGIPLADGCVDFLGLRIGGALRQELAELDPEAGLARIAMPTLVVHGDQDAAVPPATGRRFAARIPGAGWCEVRGADHVFGNGEARAALAAAMVSHLHA